MHLVSAEAGFIRVLKDCVVDGLETLGCFEMVLLVDVVADGQLIVANFEVLDTLVVQVSSLDLLEDDHCSDVVFEVQDESQLVEDVV